MSRTAVVTGGSAGIGFACAERLVERGYDVVLTARNEERLAAAAAKIGGRYVVADAAEPEQMDAVMETVEEVNLLVHSPGLLRGTFVRKQSIEDVDRVLNANLRSAFVTTHAVLPKMPVGGRIIFIGSSSSKHPQKARSAYSASKAGLDAFAVALSQEVLRDGINVNLVIPAPVETEMLEEVTFEMVALQPSDVADVVGFLDSLHPRVAIREIFLNAVSEGPLAPAPLVPAAAVAKQQQKEQKP